MCNFTKHQGMRSFFVQKSNATAAKQHKTTVFLAHSMAKTGNLIRIPKKEDDFFDNLINRLSRFRLRNRTSYTSVSDV